jgi:hypothetical protein
MLLHKSLLEVRMMNRRGGKGGAKKKFKKENAEDGMLRGNAGMSYSKSLSLEQWF